MKKLIMCATLLAGATTMMAENVVVNGVDETTKMEAVAAGPDINSDYCLYMIGRIGGDNNCMLTSAEYTFLNYRRLVKWGSYNRSNGNLILKAYDEKSRKYIGQFVGTLSGRPGSMRYKGTFTNTKGGKVTFDLQEQSWY